MRWRLSYLNAKGLSAMKAILIFAVAATATALAVAGCGSASPAPQATVTVTTTASPAGSSPAAASSSSPASAAQAAGCLTRYLHGGLGLRQGAAGSAYVNIVFKNLNNVPCTLYGYPGVAQAAGTPVTDIGAPSSENPSTPRELVTLQPGGYAYATLQIVDAANFPASSCTRVKATWLAVIPPNQRVPLYIPYQSTACKGKAHLLSVTAVRPGTGG
jgi:Protein of unknown function (DUF4232)